MKLKLIHKLLIALFACTALVLVMITVITRASIDRDFVDFLQQQEHSKLEQLVPVLANWYGARQGWDDFLDDPRTFHDLMNSTLGGGREFRPENRRPPPARRPARRDGPRRDRPGPPGGQEALHNRIFLLNADRYAIVGQVPAGASEDSWLPIEVSGELVGYLGVAMVRGVELPEEKAFLDHLRDNLLLGLGTGLVVAALLAWFMARHLSSPISAVAGGIRSVAAGNFDTRLETRGSDEISRLGEDVNRLSSALKDHESARKRWMSDMAHELRTPLAIIRGELEAMSDGVRPMDSENLVSVQNEVNHLASLVDDLHNLALTDAGALSYKMSRVDLSELVQLALESFKGQAAGKELSLEFNSPERRFDIQGDQRRLHQLLDNLLENAIRYTDAGGSISIGIEQDDGFATLTISDTAPGASTEECEKLFDRLYRVESSRNRNSGGSGLGLAICRNIVIAHGGEISAKPGPDGGIIVTTKLPLAS